MSFKDRIYKLKKHYLANPRFNEFYRERNLFQQQILQLLTKDAIWLFSLKKAGTTYTALFLSNYVNYIYGDKEFVSFDRMNKEFCVHSLEEQLKNIDASNFLKDNKFRLGLIPPYEGFFATHIPIIDGRWKKNISLSRNPLDYLISIYFYFYINRGIKCKHPRKLIGERINEFASVINSQSNIEKENKGKTILINYEDLIRNPDDAFNEMIHFLGFEYSQKAFDFALENSSKKKIKEMEKERGEAIVKKDGLEFKGSFVRSGKIGEWKDYFNDKDLKNIDSELCKYGLSLNSFILE